MRVRFLFTAVYLLCLIGCQARVPLWRPEAAIAMDRMRGNGADVLLPTEYRSIEECFALGNRYLEAGQVKDAENQFYLTRQKADLLEKRLAAEKARLEEENKKLKEETENRELERKRLPEVKDRADGQKRESPEKTNTNKERMLLLTHTVKRGETLPFIASLPEVYNDSSLWPLLYRANRDQIRDPGCIWPGQVLRIPRNPAHEDVVEARRFAQEKPVR